ncbi:SpaA isopeptide-forming pilin-related protein [Bifidobacterium sp. SO4]|uniref:SpaA isopeptide-forming pilin-related protein n=1 Tax=Bifidobacterium sp. SO4 TaxID=2809030 RepID=UPI001BDDBF09|nr:SpaA isopeptide-forming pilin-related protein [Bifidobacterium sp. SO4]MBT1171679.1 Cna B-type domain-containing protein [Bifidobacterium sp. SO4]
MNRVETQGRGLPHACRAVLGLLLAMATLLAMALPSNTAYAADGDADCSATILPVKEDGASVTWPEVRQYIDENFTGSKVFADAVYDAICTSGQNYAFDYDGVTPQTAADVIKYYGALDSRNTSITITKPLEDDAVLTGIGLLRYVSKLNVEDVGSHRGLDFMEDAYVPAKGETPTEEDPMGPAVVMNDIAITELPKNPYALNLPRTIGANYHNFQSTNYNSLLISILRRPGGTKNATVSVDTGLTGRDDAAVDLESATATTDMIYPTERGIVQNDSFGVDPFQEYDSPRENGGFQVTGNKMSVSIPVDAKNSKTYWSMFGFKYIYNYYANTQLQSNSLDYFYRTSAVYLNRVTLSGSQLVLSGARVKKVDKNDTSKGLNGATFELYTDRAGTQRAQQADLDADNKPQFVTDAQTGESFLKMKDTGTYTSRTVDGMDGVVVLDDLLPGMYYLKEVNPPSGYTAVSDQLIPVTVEGVNAETPKVTGGEGESATVAKDGELVTAVADQFAGAVNWLSAGFTNMRVTAGTENVSALLDKDDQKLAGSGVFVKNAKSNGGKGKNVRFTAASTPTGDGVTLLGSSNADGKVKVTTTGMDNVSSSEEVADLDAAQSKVNGLISGNGLDASNALIAVDAGTQVYHKAVPTTIQTTVTNEKSLQPVDVSLQATKHFKDASGNDKSISAGQFKFDLKPNADDANAKLLTPNGVTAEVGADGKATWSLPQITSDIYEKAKNDKGVASFKFIASEQQGDDSTIEYDKATVSVRLDVSKVAAADNNGTAGLKVEMFVNNESKGSVTSGEKSGALTVSADKSGISFTNKEKKPETTKVTVKKVWKNSDNSDVTNMDGLPSVDVKLQSATDENPSDSDWSDVEGKTATLQPGSWSAEWDGLPKTDNGKSIRYRVVETTQLDDYTSTVGAPEQGTDGNWSVTITNTKKKPELTEVSVKKTWSDGADKHQTDSVTVTLQQVVDGQTANVQGRDSITLSKDNNWSGSWKDLPKTTTDGKAIQYTVTESGGPSGYTPTITQGAKDNSWTITVENKKPDTPTPTETSVKVTKTWADNVDHSKDSVEATLEQSMNGTGWAKVQRDDNPVTLNADNNWTHTWDSLPTTVDGQKVQYRVRETNVSVSDKKPYSTSYSPSNGVGSDVTITNTPETPKPETVSVSASKKWVDDGSHPNKLKVTLQRTTAANPSEGDWEDVKSADLSAPDWSVSWNGLEKAGQNGKEYTYRVVEDSPSDYTQKVDSTHTGNHWSFAFTNTKPNTPPTPDTYGFSFTKVKDGTSTGLQGAVFELTGNGVTKTATSGDNGKVSFSGLKPGSYTVTETQAPSGYDLPSHVPSFTVTIGDKGKVTFSNLGSLVSCKTGTAASQCDLTVGNKPTTPPPPETPKFDFSFTKVKGNENGAPLAGAVFELRDGASVVATATSGADGKVSFIGVPAGEYTLVETVAPEGYQAAGPYTVTIDANGNVTGLPEGGKVVDKPTTPPPPENPKYPFGFTKVNTEGKALAGATFQLVDANGNVVATVTSGADGKVSVPAVAPGSYTVVETVAPEGYDKVVSFTVTIGQDGTVSGLPSGGQVVDKPTTPPEKPKYPFGFTKVNANGGPLAGAVFQLVDANGNVVATVTSGADGKVSFPAVEPGTYTVVESKAPDGYRKVADFTVTIDEQGNVTGLPANGQVVDRPVSPPDVPPTTPPTTPPTPGLPPTGVSVVAMGVVAAGAALMGVIVDWRRRRMRGRHS